MQNPPPCVLEHWASSEVDPAERLPYWHDVAHNWVDVQPLTAGADLEASWSLLRGRDCFFGTKRSTAYEMRTSARHVPPGEDMVVLSLLEAGQLDFNAAPGQGHHAGGGALGMYVPWQDGAYRWGHGARQTYVALARRAVWQALGREPGNVLIAPGQCALAPMLGSQLGHLGQLVRRPGALTPDDFAGLLAATRSLALLLLRNLGRQGQGCDLPDVHESLHAGRHAAALRFMEQHAHRPALDAAAIAQAVGCSRTRLYEAFALQGQTVMGALRELRLQRARRAIESGPRLHVGTLAWRCGFVHASDFSKLFRARFGLSPTDWHRRAMDAAPGR
ncbi:helix-turn-helix domain-containing protein [Comamonas flocculans]|uniref:AraC family transcriptional regulator n=1 Tax=Comamonas flocculans TaxID=2597701 RepID=A0A5B8RQP1_9BURK|nr:helix-turn-helix domain-containing protein [Comamonas flocculans]QEA12009.1 AraC family transcriptional regulator [Comamonas flocculans]